jgi:acyl-CoA hydrolase
VALPSTAKQGAVTRVVPVVERITALRSDVDTVVTEYGVAELRGISEGERASRLIAIAHPDHRDGLRRAAIDLGL